MSRRPGIFRSRLPAARRFQHEAGAGERGQKHERPEGPRLHEVLHRYPFLRASLGKTVSPVRNVRGAMGTSHGPSVPVGDDLRGRWVRPRTDAVQAVAVRGSPRRIPMAIVTTIPSAISTSPTLKTLANGSPAGIAKMSVSGARTGFSTTA